MSSHNQGEISGRGEVVRPTRSLPNVTEMRLSRRPGSDARTHLRNSPSPRIISDFGPVQPSHPKPVTPPSPKTPAQAPNFSVPSELEPHKSRANIIRVASFEDTQVVDTLIDDSATNISTVIVKSEGYSEESNQENATAISGDASLLNIGTSKIASAEHPEESQAHVSSVNTHTATDVNPIETGLAGAPESATDDSDILVGVDINETVLKEINLNNSVVKRGAHGSKYSASRNLDKVKTKKVLQSQKQKKKLDKKHDEKRQTVMLHVQELRKRAIYSAVALVFGGALGYRFQDQIIDLLVKPLNQKLFYTSPTGGFDFLIKICLFFGFILAVPVIVYNIIKFLAPAIPKKVTYSVYKLLISSVLLAMLGVAFAYFVSLPAALHFLSNFNNETVSSLISAQEYFSFVMIYLAGFAALFQMPLLFSFFNKITPLKPTMLMQKQRIVVLASFIIAAMLTPTPDPMNQTIMAVPIISLYQVSIGVVWQSNRRRIRKGEFDLYKKLSSSKRSGPANDGESADGNAKPDSIDASDNLDDSVPSGNLATLQT